MGRNTWFVTNASLSVTVTVKCFSPRECFSILSCETLIRAAWDSVTIVIDICISWYMWVMPCYTVDGMFATLKKRHFSRTQFTMVDHAEQERLWASYPFICQSEMMLQNCFFALLNKNNLNIIFGIRNQYCFFRKWHLLKKWLYLAIIHV